MNRLLKKRMLIISISLAFLLLINIGVSYSYYLGKVVGNESDTTLSFKSAGIKVQYENNSGEITAGDILSGWSATKNFSLSSSISENDFTNGNSKLWYEIILYVDSNDFPTDILTYTLTPSETVVGSGVAAEARTNAGIANGTNAEGISIGVGYFTAGENKHDYSITFNYVGNGSEYGNYTDNTFSVHIGAKVIIKSVLNIDLDGGSIEGGTTKYVRKGGTINLPVPIKEEFLFSGWVITSGNGEVDGNNVTVNDEVLNISAVWLDKIVNSVLVLDLDGGSSTQDTINNIKTREIYTLVEPTKDGFFFRGWQLVSGNADLSGDKLVAYDENVKIVALWQSVIPEFTYLKSDGLEAEYLVVNDGGNNWRIKFLESGTLTFTTYGNAEDGIDVFLVGGGGGGAAAAGSYHSASGGGGGYTLTKSNICFDLNKNYPIVVGAGGAGGSGDGGAGKVGSSTTIFGLIANGGKNGIGSSGSVGGDGGSGGGGSSRYSTGGAGGSDGSNGGAGVGSEGRAGGTGQGTTTREFGEESGELYAGGGGAGAAGGSVGDGGLGGGGAGGGKTATANTGGGGGGATRGNRSGGAGGSGIVIIRNARG